MSIRTSQHYRERAEHFREMAEAEGGAIRTQLLQLAADYEATAAQMEKQERAPLPP